MKFTKLVFKEHFLIDGAPNPANFVHDIGPRWANQELQEYVDSREHSYVKDGILNIIAKQKGDRVTSARLKTAGKHSWMYGHFIIKAKVYGGLGSWPAIWMLPDNIREVGWPKCGEIDIMEHVGRKSEEILMSLHSQTYNHRKNNQRVSHVQVPNLLTDFHTYEIIWDENSLTFLLDGKKIETFTKSPKDKEDEWPFNKPYFLILNLAVGGSFGGPLLEDDLPFLFQVKSIEVYQ